ncbi:hypothetical protein F4777DRAFT_544248 [Nemania sp. FL0916]|nr:hypothetical protein F4777DRAFT_544248 [Nemania sp. FL0916]
MDPSGVQYPHQGYEYSYHQPYDAIHDQDISDYTHHNYSTAHQYDSSQPYYGAPSHAVPQTFSVPEENNTPWHSVTEMEIDQATTSKPPSRTSYWTRINEGWTLEVVSQLCSVAFLLALIILLSRLDGRTLSAWTIAVSPNAFVAVLSIASKASLIYALGQTISQLKWLHLTEKPDRLEDLQHYDDASRGPLGALRMLWAVRSGQFVAYLGCVIILLALAFEPFSQQLLHFQERVITISGVQSSVSFSTAYDFQYDGVDGASAVIVGPRDNPMTAAAVNGVYDVVKDPPFVCPGTTCSYPAFTTFGICSECADVTKTIQMKRINATYGQVYSFTTPGNLTMQASASIDAHSGFKHTLTNATAEAVNSEFAGLGMPVKLAVIRFPVDGQADIDSWMDTMQAYECTMSFCGRQYSGWNTTNGTLSQGREHIIKLNNSDVPAPDEPWYRLLAPLDPAESLGADVKNNSFKISYLDGENILSILTSIFTISNGLPASQQIGATALYSSPDVMATIDNIAKGMSYRMMSGPNSTTVHGEVYTTEAYMKVVWPWITPLIFVVAASAICLIAVVFMTRNAKQWVWKSSLTPLLLPDASYVLTSANEGLVDNNSQLRSRTMTIAKYLAR